MLRKIKNIAHGFEADIANFVYGIGKQTIPVIGVTGTDGKTTTASLIFHILKTAGLHPAMITTVAAQIGENTFDTGLHNTTPTAFTLRRYIKMAIESKCDYIVLEITSHALDQNRAKGLKCRIGVLTNITHEHLDYHLTYENYVKAKSKLFKCSEISIINKDDGSYDLIKKEIGNRKIYSYAIKGDADFTPHTVGINFPQEYEFNFENFMAAVSVSEILNLPKDKVKLALATFQFPKGRQEVIYDKDFRAIVDFAHTPNSFAKILPAIKRGTTGRLIHIFGCAGQRDRSKRAMMGKIASESDDVIILTAEDPRDEEIAKINEQIRMGISGFESGEKNDYVHHENKKVVIEIDSRAQAIEFAVKIAAKGDTIIATGKGHELSMNLGHGEEPWSDQEAFEKAIKLRVEN